MNLFGIFVFACPNFNLKIRLRPAIDLRWYGTASQIRTILAKIGENV